MKCRNSISFCFELSYEECNLSRFVGCLCTLFEMASYISSFRWIALNSESLMYYPACSDDFDLYQDAIPDV